MYSIGYSVTVRCCKKCHIFCFPAAGKVKGLDPKAPLTLVTFKSAVRRGHAKQTLGLGPCRYGLGTGFKGTVLKPFGGNVIGPVLILLLKDKYGFNQFFYCQKIPKEH